jgi:hypothetical protein
MILASQSDRICMDIKNVFKVSPIGFIRSTKKAQNSSLKLDSASDRDGNGQSPYQKNQSLRDLTQEELDHALQKLKAMGPVLEHKWQVKLVQSPGAPPEILILDNLGTILKRITHGEILSLLETPSPHKGQILKKSA